ncbi:medium-chain acyl-CoA ligase ACSF2, mitochondrial isoform X2 [Daphnia magna]|uniref:medium-chain acyl-CoA ligase ACSF2, mitochondrial isoform X2 n=1 Tax=Daphnia magna TaxID=35525 RepID=UPI0006E0E344|nr:medium-chain acyl-CoA ligase ACSF2, mitochondrial isoform X2 [Daphnia magna]
MSCFMKISRSKWYHHLKPQNSSLTCTSFFSSPSRPYFQRNDNKRKYEHSYVCGPGTTPLLGKTIGQLLESASDRHGDSEAVIVVHQKIRKTYLQLLHDADQLAAGFVALKLQRGDRIGIWGPNSYEWALTQWAAARAGLILVNVNPSYQPMELKYALNKVGIKALVAAESFKNRDYYSILNEAVPQIQKTNEMSFISSSDVPSLRSVIMISDNIVKGTWRFQDVMELGGNNELKEVHGIQRQIQFDEPANIQFTSGTTGNPKGATLTHHNIVNNGYLMGLRTGYHLKAHRLCLPVPLYHCFGCVMGVLSAVSHGGSYVLSSPAFSAREAVKAVEQERCTSLYGTPTMFVDILNLPDLKSYDLSSLSTGYMAGAPCPQSIVKAVVHDLHMKDFVVAYGMTETSPVTFSGYSSDPLEVRHSTIGFPSDYTEVKVVNEQGEIVPVNTPGELCTRGYSTMLKYWDDEEKTKETISPDRWLRTGDIAVIDENGYGQIVGRAKDMLIRGGENVYPREIEELLHTHPAVAEVHVIGVPDVRLGEEVCAWVRLRPNCAVTESDLRNFCHEKVAYFKIPKYILFREDFPKTVTGKIQKFRMREITVNELNIDS